MFPYFWSANRSAASSTSSKTNEVVWEIGTWRAPVVGSGRPPAWIARVRSPQTWSSIDVTRAKVASSRLASEALGPHAPGVVAGAQEVRGGGLDERGRAAHEHVRVGLRRRAGRGQHGGGDPAPAGAGERDRGLHSRGAPRLDLRRVELVLLGADGEHEPGVEAAALVEAVAEHRAQRHQPGAARDEQQRPPVVDVPGERAAAGAADLQAIASTRLARQPGGDLAVAHPLYGQLEPRVLGRAGERVRALGGVAALGSEADVDALARAVAGPAGDVEHERADRARLVADLDHLGGGPRAAPARLGQSSS